MASVHREDELLACRVGWMVLSSLLDTRGADVLWFGPRLVGIIGTLDKILQSSLLGTF